MKNKLKNMIVTKEKRYFNEEEAKSFKTHVIISILLKSNKLKVKKICTNAYALVPTRKTTIEDYKKIKYLCSLIDVKIYIKDATYSELKERWLKNIAM